MMDLELGSRPGRLRMVGEEEEVAAEAEEDMYSSRYVPTTITIAPTEPTCIQNLAAAGTSTRRHNHSVCPPNLTKIFLFRGVPDVAPSLDYHNRSPAPGV